MADPTSKDSNGRTWVREDRRRGPDRRRSPDRREDIRFDPDKPDRRDHPDRREDHRSPWDRVPR